MAYTNGHTADVPKTVLYPQLGRMRQEFVSVDEFERLIANLDAYHLANGKVTRTIRYRDQVRVAVSTCIRDGRLWLITYRLILAAAYHFDKRDKPDGDNWDGVRVRFGDRHYVLGRPIALTISTRG